MQSKLWWQLVGWRDWYLQWNAMCLQSLERQLWRGWWQHLQMIMFLFLFCPCYCCLYFCSGCIDPEVVAVGNYLQLKLVFHLFYFFLLLLRHVMFQLIVYKTNLCLLFLLLLFLLFKEKVFVHYFYPSFLSLSLSPNYCILFMPYFLFFLFFPTPLPPPFI